MWKNNMKKQHMKQNKTKQYFKQNMHLTQNRK